MKRNKVIEEDEQGYVQDTIDLLVYEMNHERISLKFRFSHDHWFRAIYIFVHSSCKRRLTSSDQLLKSIIIFLLWKRTSVDAGWKNVFYNAWVTLRSPMWYRCYVLSNNSYKHQLELKTSRLHFHSR